LRGLRLSGFGQLHYSIEIMKAAFSLVLLAAMAYAADLSVGTATAPTGRKATGFIQVPAGVDAATSIPVIVVNGAKPGPTLALVAGSHGTEYASILALQKLAQAADPSELSGALIIVPLMNLPSFTQKVPHVNPVDGKSMNRFYPGRRTEPRPIASRGRSASR
jgi:predicted deacylase